MSELMNKLQEPFEADEIEWRVQSCGITNGRGWALALAYVTNRAIQNRLDEVFGCLGWKNEYKEWRNDNQLCGLSVWDDDKQQWITKWDGADDSKEDAIKGGLSGSMKRTAVQFGIGRYLYKLKENFAECSVEKPKDMKNWNKTKTKNKEDIYWKTPTLPNWALPTNKEEFKTEVNPKNISNLINKNQVEELEQLVEETKADINQMLKFYKINEFSELTEDKFKHAKEYLEKKKLA